MLAESEIRVKNGNVARGEQVFRTGVLIAASSPAGEGSGRQSALGSRQ